jgi:antirestriction protein ArdC
MTTDAATRCRVSAEIAAALQAGLIPWRMPWNGPSRARPPYNVRSRKPYAGIDLLLLQIAALLHGYRLKGWGTQQEWHSLLGCRPEADAAATEIVTSTVPLFNAEQVGRGSVLKGRIRPDDRLPDWSAADRVVAASGADIRHIRGLAAEYYYPPLDYIIFPLKEQFQQGPGGLTGFYDSLFHELAHWMEPRLGWSADYATNELRAEIGSCLLASRLGLPNLTDARMLLNHAFFVGHWIKAMKEDDSLIFRVVASADEAADYLMSCGREEEAAA